MRAVITESLGTWHLNYVVDAARMTGRQEISTSDGARATIVVHGTTAYLSGNAKALIKYFSLTDDDAAVVGPQWLSIPATDAYYKDVAQDVTMKTLISDAAPAGRVIEGGPVSVDGQTVIPLTGRVPGLKPGVSSSETLYVTSSDHPVPVSLTSKTTYLGRSSVETAALSDWGANVTAAAPRQALPITEVPRLVEEFSALAIPGSPGYYTFTGPRGDPGPIGRPWGQACKPVVFAVRRSVPNWMYNQIWTVVGQARRQGIDVAVESRDFTWPYSALYYRDGESAKDTAIVPIVASSRTPPNVAGYKRPADSQLGWNTRLDRDGRNEDFIDVQDTLWTKVDRNLTTLHRAIRQLIAMTQGVDESSDPSSAIAGWSQAPFFTPEDVATMLRTSGCAKPKAGTGLV